MLSSRILAGRPRLAVILMSAFALTVFGVLPSAAAATDGHHGGHHHRRHGLRFGFAKPAPATVTISSGNSVVDNFGPASVTVTRTGKTNKALNVTLNTTNGTAVAGTDYTGGPYPVTIPKGQTSTTVSIDITDDESATASKVFSVSLANPSSRIALGSPQDVTIIGDDQSGSFTVPNGYTIALNGTMAGCDQLQEALVNVSDHSFVSGLAAATPGCPSITYFNNTWTNGTGAPVSLAVQLVDTTCDATYESDDLYTDPNSGGWAAVDHTAIWTDPGDAINIAMTDAGGCGSSATDRDPNGGDPGNLQGTITITSP